MVSERGPASSPDTICRCAINRAYLTPIVKVLPMLTKQWQKHTVKLIKLKQTGKVEVCFAFWIFSQIVTPLSYSISILNSHGFFIILRNASSAPLSFVSHPCSTVYRSNLRYSRNTPSCSSQNLSSSFSVR